MEKAVEAGGSMLAQLSETTGSGSGWSPETWVAILTGVLGIATFVLAGITFIAWRSEKAGRDEEAMARQKESMARADAQSRLDSLQSESIAEHQRRQAAAVFGEVEQAQGTTSHIKVVNGSDSPVYATFARLWVARQFRSRWERGMVVAALQVTPDGRTWGLLPDDQLRVDVNVDLAVVSLKFRDSANRWWTRDREGVLAGPFEVEPPEPHLDEI